DTVVDADISELLTKGNTAQNVSIQPGDTILVSELNTVSVVGQVRSPGTYPLKEGARVSDALTEAGWPTEEAGLSNVAILRLVDGKPLVLYVDAEALLHKGDMAQNTVMQPGDTVVVPDRKVKRKLSFGDVLGYISAVGTAAYYLRRTR
ncbi:MAG: polysaccharide biosynthesis/export family protein, partial [Candidatus Binatia bacterium]